MSTRLIDHWFLEHPRTARQGYFEHLWFAWRFGASMFAGAFAAFVHGLFPRAHQTTASRTVLALHSKLASAHRAPTSSDANT